MKTLVISALTVAGLALGASAANAATLHRMGTGDGTYNAATSNPAFDDQRLGRSYLGDQIKPDQVNSDAKDNQEQLNITLSQRPYISLF